MIGTAYGKSVLNSVLRISSKSTLYNVFGMAIVQYYDFFLFEWDWLNISYPFLIFLAAIVIAIAGILFFTFKKNHSSTKLNAEFLARENEEIHRFISIVTHDLKSPLNSITAISELLALDSKTLSPDEISEYAGSIFDLSMRINHLVNNMKDVNNLEMGDVKLEIKPLDAEPLITNIHRSMQLLGNKKSIDTTLEIKEQLPMVKADKDTLSRVLENLINNAYKFSETGSTVTIKAVNLNSKNKVKISVKDEGPGFTEADKANLYNKFAKLSAKPTGEEKSTGLGLFIVYRLVKRMNGNIVLDTKPGKGSEFSIMLDTAS